MARSSYTLCKIITMWITMASLLIMMSARVNGKAAEAPCLFIFGDSLSDSGNNNNLASLAKANFLPYGIDFPGGPTGRFTNGRTTVDLIGDLIGLDSYIPPFPKSGGVAALKGVNYASGSAGILPTTGYQVGQRISMDMQLKNHQATVSRISSLTGGANNATNHLGKCIYSVYLASNDWMIDYFNPISATKLKQTPQAFADTLLAKLTQQLTSLHEMGARKVVLFGVGPLGCLPVLNTLGTCTQYVNRALQDYNKKLKLVAESFNSKLTDSKFIYIDTIGIVGDDLSGLGMRIKNIPCCGALEVLCTPVSVPCKDRNTHAYWDNAHPTEAANKVLASRAFKAQHPNDAYPMDISSLAALNI